MAVKIRLKRMGKIRAPYYRVVVMDSRTKRDGRAIEEIGKYHPTEEPSLIDIDSERAQYWLGVGAQPSEQVAALLRVTGDWQKFKGEEGAEGTLRTREPKADKKALYEAALAAADGEDTSGATTQKRKKADKAEEKAEKAPATEESATEAPAEETAPPADTEGSAAAGTGEATGTEGDAKTDEA
ncbi:SSU ribosomal protein S16p [Serinicoccus hydrothermalis]|uniref:Small ribosomal subunit protein bS16 n=1 Tax=Serinicoccus hydrothermalis TaxID=1758689 RepID=A0A1B1NGW6_9MICO|nr:30S ribosomal protein S16 [Serinicoccus hydrothermalis]ANS80668.1 SSU ribosomal protein S16p [Serinicoccus hydrothermalis]